MSIEKNKLILSESTALREDAARAEFLRCLCLELRKQNGAILAAEAAGAGKQEPLSVCLRRAGEAARAQRELLETLESVVRCL